MPAYRVTIDKDACEGIFACLTRDPRFVEDDDGLATLDPDGDPVYDGTGSVWHTGDDEIVAAFDDDRIDEAQAAACACPPGAITVETVPEVGAAEESARLTPDGGDPET